MRAPSRGTAALILRNRAPRGLVSRVRLCHIIGMRRLTHLLVLAAFIFSCGGQWAAFQAIAWANMIREYSEMVPLTQAVQMTFSGRYPCAICKAIAQRKSAEQQKELALAKYEKQYPLPAVVTLERPKVSATSWLEPAFRFSSRSETPPTPPPRPALS